MNLWDVLAVAGVLLVAGGAGLVYFPAALIVLGAGCLAAGLVGARAQATAPDAEDARPEVR